MEGKHTQGPWKVGSYLGSVSTYCVHMDVITKGRGMDIVEAVYGGTTHEKLANARLIASAPDLLKSVKQLLALHIGHHNEPTHVAARLVVSKTESGQ